MTSRVIAGLAAILGILSIGDMGSASLQGQTPPWAKGVTVTTVLENDRVRVSRVVFEPGGQEALHTHDYDLLTISLAAGRLEVASGGSTSVVELAPGEAGWVPKGAPHGARNPGEGRLEVITVALK